MKCFCQCGRDAVAIWQPVDDNVLAPLCREHAQKARKDKSGPVKAMHSASRPVPQAMR